MRRFETSFWALAIVVGGGLLMTWFGARSAAVAGRVGFPLDDAWIHVRFAQNVAQNGCFAFNPGEPTAGSTSPLWVILLAGASLLSGEFLYTAIYLGVLTYLLWVLSTYWIVRRQFGENGPAILAALIVLVNVRVAWGALSGMEICLAGWLALVACACFAAEEANRRSPLSANAPLVSAPDSPHAAQRWLGFATPVLFGLASLARPEAHLLFGLAVFLRVVRSCRRDTPIRELARLIPYRMILVYVLVTVPWHLFALWSSGSPLPNTFRANYRGLATRIIPPGYYSYYARWLFTRDHPWIYWFGLLGMVATIRGTFWPNGFGRFGRAPSREALAFAQIAALWEVCYPAATRAIIPMMRHHMRYQIPLTGFHAFLAVLGLWMLIEILVSVFRRPPTTAQHNEATEMTKGTEETGEKPEPPINLISQPSLAVLGRGRAAPALWFALTAGVAVSAGPGLARWAAIHGSNVYSINHQHVAMAEWIRDHTPADAVITTHDIGAIGAISQRRIVDLFGLVTPEMIHTVDQIIPTIGVGSGWYLDKVRAGNSSYLIGYPQWLGFMAVAPRCFDEIHREVLERMDICGGLEMVAYRIDLDRLKQIPSRP